jgi:hypothetical protein
MPRHFFDVRDGRSSFLKDGRDALERQWNAGREEASFVARDRYVARHLDLFDLLGSAYRLART